MRRVSANGALDHSSAIIVVVARRRRQPRGTLKAAVPLVATDGTDGVFVVLERAVQNGQFAELLLLVHVLFVVEHDEHVAHHLFGGLDGLGVVARDDDVEGIGVAGLRDAVAATAGALLDAAAAANGNLASRLGFEFFLGLASGTDNETNEIVIGVLVNGNGYFDRGLLVEQ